jgi:aspartyl-tRNA synthetase
MENMRGLKRTHYCTDIDENIINQEVVIMGWVNKRRDLGQLIFITLRDRTGVVQTIIDTNQVSKEIFCRAETIRGEYVLAIKGVVKARNNKDINLDMKTGKIEIEVLELKILSEALVPPFQIADVGVNNDMKLKYRYLDLRRPELQRNLILRNKASLSVRQFLNDEGFIEVETPILTKSTPEGARDYLVPSRVYPGNFYALPQSPQIFKQLLMVSGIDRYYQIAKCFRDEDLRADRQPEFTQIDIELSFVDMEDIININERLMSKIFKDVLDIQIQTPFLRMTYKEAMERFGSDKPDIRFGMELVNVSNVVKGSDFAVFENALTNGGSVRGINVVGSATMPRKKIDSLVDFVKDYKAKGLAWINVMEDGTIKSTITKFFDENKINEIVKAFEAKPGDLILLCADKDEVVFNSLGALRCELAKRLELTRNEDFKFLWVTEFPMFEWSEEDNRLYAKHHPFTAPMEEDIKLLDSNPIEAKALAYDMVLNGTELGGGSIRIYQSELQEKMFKLLGFTEDEAKEQFGFMMDAFKYGAPPHGGIAFGLDRIIMLLTGAESIRDVIAFPKVKDASCPMTNAPDTVLPNQLEQLGLLVKEKLK